MNRQGQRRVAALLEVLGVYAAGGFVTDQMVRFSGLKLKNPLENLTVHITGPELLTAADRLFVLLLFQYAGYFLLIIPINWWYRRTGPVRYGLTRAGYSCPTLFMAGLGTAALSEWLVLGVGLVNKFHPARLRRGGRRFLTCPGRDGSSGCFRPYSVGL